MWIRMTTMVEGPVRLGYMIEDIRKRSERGEVDIYNVDKFDIYTRGLVRLGYTIEEIRKTIYKGQGGYISCG